MHRTLLRTLVGALLVTSPLAVVLPAQATLVPECVNGDLTAAYHALDSATSHRYGRIVLTNTSDHACTVRGFGGLSYVGHGDGTQIGAAAIRSGSASSTTLQPGDKVRSRVTETVAGVYPTTKCRPTAVDGFRIYVPDSTVSQYLPHATTGCARNAVKLLEHRAYR